MPACRRRPRGRSAVRMRVDPERGFDRAAAVAGGARAGLARPAGDHLDKAAGEQMADFVETDIAAAVCCGLRQFAEHHQFRQRRRRADLPDRPGRRWPRPVPAPEKTTGTRRRRRGRGCRHIRRRDGRPAPIPPPVRGTAAAVAAETALADIGDRVAAMLLPRTACRRARRCSGSRTPRSIGAAAGSYDWVMPRFRHAGAAGQPAAARRTGSCCAASAPSIDSRRRLEMAPPFGEILSHSCRPRARDGRAR